VSDERARRARSFSSVAEVYERARPEYPAEAARWLTGDPPLDVVDLAAGTGKLTRVLTTLGHRVTAVEPLAEMRAHLGAAVPGAPALDGTAEAIPLADESADVVVAAQAFHWFDQPLALREIARVLRPGGRLGLIWNMRDETVEWVARLSTIVGAEPVDRGETSGAVDASALFGPVERREWRWRQPLTRDRLRELVLSRSYCAALPDVERAPILEAVERLHDEAAGADGLSMPYVTYGFRAARR
jgi:SAM-dependent methyltransferase